MVAVVSGNGLGLFNTSRAALGAVGSSGNPTVGPGHDQVFVNSTTGNLVIQSVDENLPSAGTDQQLVRTYNSQGRFDGDNDDNWRIGGYRTVQLNGSMNDPASTITKTFGDGAEVVYRFVSPGVYQSTDGEGAHDTISYDPGTSGWIWTEGTSLISETYDSQGRMVSERDAGNNVTTYQYLGSKLELIMGGGGYLRLTYTGDNLTKVYYQPSQSGEYGNSHYYEYDSLNRLTKVSLDYWALDDSISDGATYVTEYRYAGDTHLISEVFQHDGQSPTVLASQKFTYELNAGLYRVKTVTDGEGRVTTFNYSQANNPSGTGSIQAPAAPAQLHNTETHTEQRTFTLNGASLTTPVTGWGTAALLESAGGAIIEPKVAFDSNGNGFAVWVQGNDVLTRRYTRVNDTWAAAVTLDSNNNAPTSPTLAMDAAGNAVIAWSQSNGSAVSAYGNRYDVTTGTWGTATLLESTTQVVATTAYSMSAAIDGANAAVAFLQSDGTRNNLYVTRYSGGSWGAATLVEARTNVAAQPSLDIDGLGNIAVVFQQSDGTANSTYVNRYRVSNGTWAGASLLESSGTAIIEPKVMFDSSGNGFAVWAQGADIISRRYTISTDSWAAAVTLETNANTASAPTLAMDAAGNAVVAWAQSNGSAVSAYANRFNVTTGTWTGAALLETTNQVVGATAYSISASINGTQAAVAFLQSDGTRNNVYVTRLNSGGTWGTATLVESRTNVAAQPIVSIDSLGNTAVVFQQSDGTANSIYVTRNVADARPYYVVPGGTNWQNVATAVYQNVTSPNAGAVLAAQLTGQTLTAGNRLVGFNPTLTADVQITDNVAPYFIVTVADWVEITNTLYGTRDPNAVLALKGATGEPVLSVNLHLTVPTTLTYSPQGSVTIPAGNPAVSTAGTVTTTQHPGLIAGAPTNAASMGLSAIDAFESQAANVAGGPLIARNANGDGFAVWAVGNAIHARRYSATTQSWGADTVIASGSSSIYPSDMKVDAAGNAVVVWTNWTATYDLHALSFSAASGTWSDSLIASAISYGVGYGNSLSASIAAGRAAITYLVKEGGIDRLHVARYSAGTWSTGAAVDSSSSDIGHGTAVIDSAGNITAAWEQRAPNSNIHVHTSRWDAATSAWSTPQLLNENTYAYFSGNTQLAVDAAGNVFALYNLSRTAVVRRYDIATHSWQAPTTVNALSYAVYPPKLAVDAAGNAIVAYLASGLDMEYVFVRRYSAATQSWRDPELVASTGTPAWPTSQSYAIRSVEFAGRFAAVSWDGAGGVHFARFADGQWTEEPTVVTNYSVSSLDSGGNEEFLYVGTDAGGVQSVFHKRFSAPHLTIPPSANWQSLANTLYGINSVAAGNALRDALGNPPLTSGNRLEGLPQSLAIDTTIAATVAPYYTVQSGDTWQTVAMAVYGQTSVAIAAALRRAAGEPALIAGHTITVPDTLYFGADQTFLSTDVVDPLGNTSTYVVDAQGRLTATRSPLVDGQRIELGYGYDADGNVTSITQDVGGLNRVTNFYYDSHGNLQRSRDSLGNTVVRGYDAANQVITETHFTGTDPDGAGPQEPAGGQTTHFVYDSYLHLLRFEISPSGRVTEYRYTGFWGRQLESKRVYTAGKYSGSDFSDGALGTWASQQDLTKLELTKYQFSFAGQIGIETRYAATDANGNGLSAGQSQTTYMYNGRGVEIYKAGPVGSAFLGVTQAMTSGGFDALNRAGSVSQIIDSSWARLEITYDDVGHVQRVRDAFNPLGYPADSYNFMNQVGEITRSQRVREVVGNIPTYDTTNYAYDAGGRLRMVTDPAGLRSYYLYDSLGRKVGDIDAAGRLTRQVYNHANELVATIRYSSLLSATALASLVDAQGKPASVDINDLVASLASVSGRDASKDQVTRNVFDAAGRLVYTIDPTGAVTKTNYDGTGRVTGLVAYATRVSIPDSITQVTVAQLETVGSAYKVSVDVVLDRVTRNIYDQDGLLVATLDGEGYLTEFEFDAGGRLLARHSWAAPTDPLLRATGTPDLLRPAADPRDIHVHHMYDGEGRDIAVIDGEGFLTENVYDDASNLAQVIRYGNSVTWTSIATLDSLRSAATGVNHVTSYRYDGLGRVVQETNYEGTVNTASYDGRGNLMTSTAASGTSDARTVSKRYDAMGHLIAELTAEGSAALASGTDYQTAWDQYATHYQYDSSGHRISSIDPQGNRTLYFYDVGGELRFALIDHGDGQGELTETRYDALGQQITRVEYSTLIDTASLTGGLVDSTILARAAAAFDVVHDQVTTLNYARNGQVEYTNTSNETPTDADDARTTFHYNAFGEITSQEERIDGATRLREHSYGFDRRGLQTSIAWEPGTVNQTQATEYDAFGRATKVTDQYNNITRIEYDRLGRVVTTYDALNQSRSVSYDAFSRVFSSTDALQKTTSYSYDDAARSVTITTPELISVTTTHNREGQTLTITDSLGLRNGYEYDANGQVKRSYDALGDLETRFYDRAGRLTDSHDANNVVTHFAYDAANRVLTRTSDYGGLTLQTVFAYDGQGRVTRVTEPGGRITDTSYYGDGRVRDVTVDPDGLHIVTHYDYDLTGNAIKVTEDATGAKPRITQYRYDDLGRRTDQIVDPTELVGASGLNLHTQYRYDRNGNLTRKIDGEGHSTWYVFDQNNRLTETIDALGGVTSVSYDAEGRVIETRRHASKVETSAFQDIVAAQGLAPTVRDRITRSFYDADGRERFTVATASAQDNGGTIVERGVVTERTFDVQGKVTQVRIHRNDIAIPANAHTADIAGLVSTHAEDRFVSTLYDLRGRALFNIDVYRGISRNWYDASGRLVRITTYAAAPDGSVNLDVAGLTTWSDAREGNGTDQTQRFWYDAIGRVRYALDGEGYLKETQYLDATREVVEYAYANKPTGLNPAPSVLADSAHDKKTTTLRDAAGRISKVTQVVDYQFDGVPTPGSLFEQYTYDGVGNKRSYRNANGDVWTYDYDASGRLSAEFSPELWVTTVDASGNDLVRHPEFVSVVTRITYDDIGNVQTRTEGIRRNVAAGTESSVGTRTTTYGYDLLGRQTSVTHPQVMVYTAPGNDAQNTDINDQLKEVEVTPTSTTTYNTLGDAITNQDVNGAISRKAYDELGRLRFDVDALGYVTEYTFDNFGNVTDLTRHGVALSPSAIADEWTAAAIDTAVGYDNSDRTIFTEYDRLNRRTRVTQPAFISYTPDAIGLLPGIYVQAIGETRYEYDAFGQLTRERKLLDQERGVYADTWFLYDNNGQRRYTVDDLHYVTEERFDAFGRVTLHDEYVKSIAGSAPWTLAAVQAAIQPTLSGGAHPNGLDRKTTFEYDSLGRMRLQQVYDVEFKTGNGASTGSDFGTQQTKYEYDAVGNRTQITDHYNAVTWTFYDALGRVRAIVEPARAADTNGDFFVETDVQPLTELNRNAYGDIVEQIRFASGALAVSANGYTAPGGASITNRLLLDVYGHVRRSQDGTLAPDGSLTTKYFSYNVRGDVAKEWQIFTDADNRKYVQSVIHQYDALGRETMTIQPQVRSDTVPVEPTTFQVVKAAGFMYEPGGGQWIYSNEVSANFTPANVPGQVWVYLDYTRTNPNGPPNDPHHQSTYVSGSAGHATFAWTDTNTQPPAFPANGGIASVERVRVYGQDAQGFYTVLLRDSDGNPPGAVTGNSQVAYAQTRYNGFGEITERGVNAAPVDDNTALQEYWSYDGAGHVWKSNADGGVDKVYLYDVASRVTAEIRNQRVNFIRDLTGAEGAYYASDRMMTETMYDSLHHVTAQRTPTFDIDERLDPATTSVSISLVNGRPFLQWVGTMDPSIRTDFKYSFNNLDWTTLQVVELPNGMLGVDVTDLARVNLVVLNFQIVKSLSLQFAPFAVSSGTFHVKLGETVTFGIESKDNPRVATPVIGPGPTIGPTSFDIERRAPWYQSGPTGQWIYDNKVNAFWDPTGLTGNVRVYLFYTRELAGGNAIGDTETRTLDVSGASGYADFTWTDINRFPPDNPVNGGIWSVQKIEVYGQNAQGQYTVLLRGPNGSPAGPVRLRWTAPPAELFANPVFYYKRSDSPTWSVGLTPTASNGQLEVDVNTLLIDDTVYDYRIEYWQQNTGILLARKEGQIDSTGLFVDGTISGTLLPDPLTGVFDQLVPVADVNGLNLRWADPGAAVDEIEFRWGVPGSGTYSNAITVSRAGGFASVYVGDLPPSTDYGYQVTYRIAGRTVSQQQNLFHLSALQSTSTKSAAVSVTPDATPQPAQPVATISGSNNVQTASWGADFGSQTYFTPPVSGGNPGQWIGASVVSVAWPDTGTQTVRILLDYHNRTTLQTDGGQVQRWSPDLGSNPDHYIWIWQDGNGSSTGNQGIFSIQRVRVYAVTATGATGALLRDSQASGGTAGPPRLTWAAPADTSLTARFFYGLGLGQERTPTLSNGVYTVDLTGLTAATYDFEVRYYRPNNTDAVSLATGQFVTDGSSVSLNGAQQNIVRDPQWIAASSSGNNVTWSRAPVPANSQIYFEYFDGSWHYAATPTSGNGTNYNVDMTFLPDGTYNNMLYRVSYYTPGGTTPYARGTGTFSVTVSTSTSTPTPVLTRDATPPFNQKYPTLQITGVARSGNQITWNYPRVSGDRVFLRYQINGGSIVELEQAGAGPDFAVTIPELGVDGSKSINWWVEYRSGSPGSARALANGHGTLVVSSTTTYPVSTLLSANDVYPTAIYLPDPYQVGGVYSNLLRWDSNPDPGDIVEFKVNGVVVNTLSPDKHQIDLTGFSGQITYELTFRHSNQSQAYARNAGTMTVGRATAYPETIAGLNQVPIQPRSTPFVKLTLDRWGNVLEQAEGAVWNALDDNGVMQRSDIVRLRTQYAYNVFGQLTTTTNEDVSILDTRGPLDPAVEIPIHYDDVTTANYYDMLGRQVATRDENGNFNGVTLNLAGQVTGELHADGGTKSYLYDAFGRQIQVQDEIGWRVRTSYDAANRQTQVQTEWAPELWLSREFTYDEIGRRIAETSGAAADAGGEETTRYFYDLAGNLIRRRSALGATTTYTYDVDGHETSERNAIGALTRFETDHFGNLQHKWDLSDERTDYYYNGAGLLDWTTSTRANLLPYQMDYEYDGAGHLTAVIDNATNRRADYGFDTYGRLRRERTVVDGVTHQDTQTIYDAFNRISKIVDLRYSLQYYYDAHSNRTLVISNYLDHVHALHTDNLWYTYDEMNRVEFSEGNRRHDEEGWHEIALTSDRGTYSEYQQNGQRAFTDQFGKGVLHFSGAYSYVDGYYREAYEYDGAGRLHALWHSTTTNGNDQVEVREYDGASRLIRSEQRRVNQSNTHFYYDDDGQMYQQVVRQTISDEGAITSKTDFNNDAAGVQRGYLTTVYNPNGTRKEEYSYGNHYRLADGYLLDRQDVQLTKYNSNGNNPNNFYGTIERIYDVNNNVVKMYDSNGAADRKYRHLANNLQGEVMTAIEGDFADDNAVRQGMKTAVEGNANLNYAQHFFHTHGASVGSLGQLDGTVDGQPNPTEGKKARFFGIAAWGDSWAGGAARRPIPLSGRMPDGSMWQPPKPPSMNANFDANFTDIGSFQASATSVVVQQGDTLRSIATRLFGDGALWYLLADENGLADPDTALQAGSNLRVPTQVYALANTAHIYKPFDSSEALSGKQPTLIDPTPPPPKQPCGGHAKLILTIIAVVVTAIVAYFMGPASGPVAAFFQGMIAAVAGNAVSQGVAIGMGLQEGFNWKQAALAGVSGGIGGAIAPAVGQFLPNSPIAAGFVSGAIGNTITQGASIALGLQKSFSWKDVAMSAVSGAANAAIAKYAPSAFNQPQSFLGDFGKSLVTGATGSVVQAAFGGKIDGLDIAANAFGTALGNSIVRGLQGAPKLGVGSKQDKPKDEGAEDELAEVVVTAQRRGAGLSGNPQGASIVGLGDDPFADDGMMPSMISPDELEMEFDPEEILASLGSSMPNIEESVVAKSGDSISRILGTSDPAAIGAFMRANGLTSSTIRAGDEYVIPNGAPTAEDQAAGQSVLNHDEQRRADRAVARAAAEESIVPALLRRPGQAAASTNEYDNGGNAFLDYVTKAHPWVAGASGVATFDAMMRGKYSQTIEGTSKAALEQIEQLKKSGGSVDDAIEQARRASAARDATRPEFQKKLSPAGEAVSKAVEGEKLTFDQRLANKGGRTMEGAEALARSAGKTRPVISGLAKTTRILGPVGIAVQGYLSYQDYKAAPPGEKGAVAARLVGEAAGGAVGYTAGAFVATAALVAIAAPAAAIIIGAAVVGGLVAWGAGVGWGKISESAYKWWNN